MALQQGLLAAAACLLVAWTNSSAAGFLFLAAFLAWGASLAATSRARALNLQAYIWGVVASGAAALFTAQLVVQALYTIHAIQPASALASWLDLLGLGPLHGSWLALCTSLAAPMAALLASVSEAQECRALSEGLQGQQQQQQQHQGQYAEGGLHPGPLPPSPSYDMLLQAEDPHQHLQGGAQGTRGWEAGQQQGQGQDNRQGQAGGAHSSPSGGGPGQAGAPGPSATLLPYPPAGPAHRRNASNLSFKSFTGAEEDSWELLGSSVHSHASTGLPLGSASPAPLPCGAAVDASAAAPGAPPPGAQLQGPPRSVTPSGLSERSAWETAPAGPGFVDARPRAMMSSTGGRACKEGVGCKPTWSLFSIHCSCNQSSLFLQGPQPCHAMPAPSPNFYRRC